MSNDKKNKKYGINFDKIAAAKVASVSKKAGWLGSKEFVEDFEHYKSEIDQDENQKSVADGLAGLLAMELLLEDVRDLSCMEVKSTYSEIDRKGREMRGLEYNAKDGLASIIGFCRKNIAEGFEILHKK